MLVTAIKDVIGYGPIVRIPKGRRCVVYAVETINEEQEYYVIPLFAESGSTEFDPLAFSSDNFILVEDKISANWLYKDLISHDQHKSYRSFPEWLDNNFYTRAHDWSLEDDDYAVIKKYKDLYEHTYGRYSKYDIELSDSSIDLSAKIAYKKANQKFIDLLKANFDVEEDNDFKGRIKYLVKKDENLICNILIEKDKLLSVQYLNKSETSIYNHLSKLDIEGWSSDLDRAALEIVEIANNTTEAKDN